MSHDESCLTTVRYSNLTRQLLAPVTRFSIKSKGSVFTLLDTILTASVAAVFAVYYTQIITRYLFLQVEGILLFVLLLRFIWTCSTVLEESMLVMKGHGIQLESKYLLGTRRQFVELQAIRAIIINEGFHMGGYIYYMALIVKDSAKMVLPFQVRFV
jgi:signal transduction histidine kinase